MPSFLDEARRYCGWLTRRSGSHFFLGMALLPKEKRQAMEVVYAYCRAIDDVVDRDGSEGVSGTRLPAGSVAGKVPDTVFIEAAQQELHRWRRELAACAAGFATHPITVALKPLLKRYQVPLKPFEDLIAGMEMDLTRRRYATFQELQVYCEHVASAVGLISVRVFGCRHPAADRYARNLGIALQLTNILRDLRTDFLRGRIYLPREEMDRFGITESDLAQGRLTESFKRLMAFQCERAREFFQQAEEALHENGEARKLKSARIMGGIYAELLRQIEKSGYGVFSHRISVPRFKQLRIAGRCLLT